MGTYGPFLVGWCPFFLAFSERIAVGKGACCVRGHKVKSSAQGPGVNSGAVHWPTYPARVQVYFLGSRIERYKFKFEEAVSQSMPNTYIP